MLPLFALVLAIGSGARVLAGEEEAGRLELLFAYPLRRRDGVLAKGATVGVEVALFVVAVAARDVALRPGLRPRTFRSRVAGAAASLGVLALLHGWLALAVAGFTPSKALATAVPAALAAAGYLVAGPARPRGLARPAPLRLGLLVGRPGAAARGRVGRRRARRRRRGGSGARRRRVPDRATRPEDAVARPRSSRSDETSLAAGANRTRERLQAPLRPASVLRPSVHDNDRPARARQRLPRTRSLARAARYARTERGIVTLALGAIGLHVADDNYLQPEPGTSPLDHLASGLVPIGLLAAVAVLYPRVRAGVRGWLASDLRRPRDRVRRPERVLALPGRGVGRPLHDRPAGDPRRHRPDGHRPRRPVAVAAHLRIPNAHLPPPGA